MEHILAIDQGTTSSRAIIFDRNMQIVSVAQEEFNQHYPASGWVEHEPFDLLNTTLRTCRDAIGRAGLEASQILAVGIANQRETTIVWDKNTGAPIHRAIVWQDRRTAELCAYLRDGGHEEIFSKVTGLLIDSYFSATKIS